MVVLAVESATEGAGVAVIDESGILASVALARGRRHAETVAPAIEFVCRQVGLALGEVDVLGVDVGPGLFTGLRVGVATVKALAFALDVPVACASSLEVVAHAVARRGMGHGLLVVPVVDARRGEVFAARFRLGHGDASRETDDALWSPEALAADLVAVGEPLLLAGDGASRYSATLGTVPGATVVDPAVTMPPVAALAHLCLARATAGDVRDAAGLLPNYLRQADARIHWETRLAPRPTAPTGS